MMNMPKANPNWLMPQFQMFDIGSYGGDFFGDSFPVASIESFLHAHEADPFRFRLRYYQVESVELPLENFSVFFEIILVIFGSLGILAQPTGTTKLFEMNVFDTTIFQSPGQIAFGEALFFGVGIIADVEKQIDFV